MKSPLEAPEKQIAEETSAKSASRTHSSFGELAMLLATGLAVSRSLNASYLIFPRMSSISFRRKARMV